jgi:hypothetical protein
LIIGISVPPFKIEIPITFDNFEKKFRRKSDEINFGGNPNISYRYRTQATSKAKALSLKSGLNGLLQFLMKACYKLFQLLYVVGISTTVNQRQIALILKNTPNTTASYRNKTTGTAF